MHFTLLSIVEEIESLPLANTPEVMGLHSNAEIGYYTQAAKDMWGHLIDLQPQTGVNYSFQFFPKCISKEDIFFLLYINLIFSWFLGDSGGSISRDDYICQVAQDIQDKLPILFDLDVLRKTMGIDISPTTVVLLQELERFNKLVVRMRRSLAELQKV